jgi:hypothetical protein
MREEAAEKAGKECRELADEWQKETAELTQGAHENLEKARDFILHALLG